MMSILNKHENPRVTLLLPVKNEIDGLKKLIPQINSSLFVQILMVDGGSTDGSVEYARQCGIEICFQTRPGLALGIMDSINYIKGDYIITFSPDGNCPPDILPGIIEKFKAGHELVVVSRYLPPARSYDDTLITRFGNYLFTSLIKLIVRRPMSDALTIYRGYKVQFLKTNFINKFLWGPVLEPLVTIFASLHQISMVEIPGDEPPRLGGVRKMKVLSNGFYILVLIFRVYYWRCLLFLRKKNPLSSF